MFALRNLYYMENTTKTFSLISTPCSALVSTLLHCRLAFEHWRSLHPYQQVNLVDEEHLQVKAKLT